MKKILIGLSFIVFFLLVGYNFNFLEKIHPDEPYEAVLSTENSNSSSEYYVRLLEVKNNTALLSIEEGGQSLVQTGDKIIVGKNGGHVFFGQSFKGVVEVLSVDEENVKVFVDINKTKVFYIINGTLNILLSGMISYAFFMIMTGLGKSVSWLFKLKNDFRKRKFKLVK